MANCRLATPSPFITLGRMTNSGSIHDNCSDFLTGISVTGLVMSATSTVSMLLHSPQPSLLTTAMMRPWSASAGSSISS
nr:hypothetical protein [Odoribacter sp.]